MATNTSPADVLITGRLSFPRWKWADAVAFNAGSKYPKAAEDVRPHVQLLLNETQFTKLKEHLIGKFLPWAVANEASGDKNALTAAQAKKIETWLEARDWEEDPIVGLIKPVYVKTLEMAPDLVATATVNGFKGTDLEPKVLVRDVSQLKNSFGADGEEVILPERGDIYPASDTKVELYPGSLCAAQVNLWAFVTAKTPGIMASTRSVTFIADRDRLGGGGGGDIDIDDLFLDDDE